MQSYLRPLVFLCTILCLFVDGLSAQFAAQIQLKARADRSAGNEDLDNAADFHTDRDTMRLLKKTQELIGEKRWADAVLHLGQVLNAPEDYFFVTDEQQSNYRSSKVRALELIAEMPREGREAYQLEFGAFADKLLNEAVSSGSPKKLAEVARRFFHTDAGYEATHYLGMHYYDRGRPLAAALFFERLHDIPEVRVKLDPYLTLKIAASLNRVGTTEARNRANAYLQELSQRPTEPVRLAGRLVRLDGKELDLEWLERTLGPQIQQPLPGNEEWVLHKGNAARNAPSVGGPPLMNFRWRIPTANDKPGVEKLIQAMQKDNLKQDKALLPAMIPLAVKLNPREASLLYVSSVRSRQWPRLLDRLINSQPGTPEHRIWQNLTPTLQRELKQVAGDLLPDRSVRQRFVDEMNGLFSREDFFEPEAYAAVDLRMEASQYLRRGVENLHDDEVFRLNRTLFEAVFPREVTRSYADVVLMRTLNNLLAIDFVTGKRVWEIPVDENNDHLERLLRGDQSGTATNTQGQVSQELRQRLYYDGTFGTISSDGRRVFSVEDLGLRSSAASNQQLRRMRIINRNQPSNANGPTTYNRLVAYEIRNGKLLWEVGGAPDDGLELAGMYFLGPPLPLAGQLYVLGEVGNEARLVVLDANTGKPQWSQNLAQAKQPLLADNYRGLSGVSPSYADGVIVCPTGAGATVAVDLTTRSLRWGYRYRTRTLSNRYGRRVFINNNVYQSRMGLNEEGWVDAVSVIADGKAVLTPYESDEIHCLNLLSGERAWKKPREDSLFVAAIRQGEVILVGRRQIRGLRLEDGKQVWATPLPSSQAMPSGRGFLTGDTYFLPLTTAEILHIDLANKGKIRSSTKSRTGDVPGNLICFKGTVISQGVEYLESFDELTVLERQILRDLQKDPNDAGALARRGEIYLQRGQIDAAIADFRKSYEIDDSPRTRQLLVEALLEGLRVDFAANRQVIPEAEKLIALMPATMRASLKSRFLRLQAMGLQEIGEEQEAFTIFLQFVDPEIGRPEMEHIDGTWSVRRDRWVQGRLAALFAQASPEQRALMDEEIFQRLAQSRQQSSPAALEQFIAHFGSHASATEARRELATLYQSRGKLLQAELIWQQLLQAEQPELQAEATAQLAGLLMQAQRPEDAARYYRLLKTDLADQVCLAGKTGKELFENLPKDSPVRTQLSEKPLWATGMVESEERRGGSNRGVRYYPVAMLGDQPELFQFHPRGSIVLDNSRRRFIGRNVAGDSMWEVNLQEENNRFNHLVNSPFGNTAKTSGHFVLLCAGHHLFALNTIPGSSNRSAEILWKESLLPTLAGVNQQQRMQFRVNRNQVGRRQLLAFDGNNNPVGPIGPVIGKMLPFVRQRELYMVDLLTGDPLWIQHNAKSGGEIFGDDEYLFLLPPEGGEAQVYRTLDGEFLGTRTIPPSQSHILGRGRKLFTWERRGNHSHLVCYDLWQEKELWSQAVNANAKITLSSSEQEVATYDRESGQMKIISLRDGKVLVDAKGKPDKDMNEFYVIRSGEQFIVMVSHPYNRGRQRIYINGLISGEDNPVISGMVYSFDTHGNMLWQKEVDTNAIDLRQHEELPVLVFAARVQQQVNNRWRQDCKILCLDKRTGRVIYDKELNNQNVGAFDIRANPELQQIELVLTQSTLRLDFTDRPWPEPEKKDGEQQDAKKPDQKAKPDEVKKE